MLSSTTQTLFLRISLFVLFAFAILSTEYALVQQKIMAREDTVVKDVLVMQSELTNVQTNIRDAYVTLTRQQATTNQLSGEHNRNAQLLFAYESLVKQYKATLLEQITAEEYYDFNKRSGNSDANDDGNNDNNNDNTTNAHAPNEEIVVIRHDIEAGEGNGTDVDVAAGHKVVDAEANEYVLSKAGDGDTHQRIDDQLASDMAVLVIASALGGFFATLLNLPSVLGYLLAGILVGPHSLMVIDELVQVQTFTQFGATFLLFNMGYEFRWTQMQNMKALRTIAVMLQLVLFGSCFALIALVQPDTDVGINSLGESVLCGIVLAMSSTPFVLRHMEELEHDGSTHGNHQSRKATRLVSDVFLLHDFFLFIVIVFCDPGIMGNDIDADVVGTFIIDRIALTLFFLLMYFLWSPLLQTVTNCLPQTSDVLFACSIVVASGMVYVSYLVIAAPEVGAFFAGSIVASGLSPSDDNTHFAHKYSDDEQGKPNSDAEEVEIVTTTIATTIPGNNSNNNTPLHSPKAHTRHPLMDGGAADISNWTNMVHDKLGPFAKILSAISFTALGMYINPLFLWQDAFATTLAVMSLFSLKFVISLALLILFNEKKRIALRASMHVIQVGEYSLIPLAIGTRLGIIDSATQEHIIAMVLISVVLTPITLRIADSAKCQGLF